MSVPVADSAAPRLQVLHVDDDPLNLRVVHDILLAFGHVGYRAASGPAALEQLSARIFDVVLLDVHMPGMGGIELARRIRASVGPERRTPLIALTADAFSRSRQDYLNLGFQEFVTKPILVSRFAEVLLRVTAPIRAAEILRRSA